MKREPTPGGAPEFADAAAGIPSAEDLAESLFDSLAILEALAGRIEAMAMNDEIDYDAAGMLRRVLSVACARILADGTQLADVSHRRGCAATPAPVEGLA